MTSFWNSAAAITALTLSIFSTVAGAADDSPSTTAPHFGTWGYDLTGRDLTVKPGTDFYLYSNGNWLKRAVIPADKSVHGNFNMLGDLSEAIVRKLIEDAAAGRSDDRDAAKIGAAYRAYMDEARAEQLDAAPLASELAAIRAEKSKADVVALMGQAVKGFQYSLFGMQITSDIKAPNRKAVYLGNGGMGLPDRDYYLANEMADKKAKYQAYVAAVLGMIGWADADINAKAIVDFETKLAEASWTRVEARDPDTTYNPMTVAELAGYAPGFDFRAFLDKAGLGAVDRVVVITNTAFPKVAKIFDATPLETLQAWQAYHLANDAAPFLSKRFVDAYFDFNGRTLNGQPQMGPRWKRGVAFVNTALGESIGRMYAAAYFPPDSKAKMDVLVKEVIAAMHARIERLDWMTPATKAKAQEKLAKLTVRIGYPAKWRDYGALAMTADDLYGNAVRLQAYVWADLVKRLDEPVDKEEWGYTPQTVNAGYSPDQNSITFPAAILQPPFFDPTADMAINYGGIGGVIGHEITHGFDDQGRKFDGDGVLTNWWTPDDVANFKSRTDVLAAQFDKFEAVKGYFINGRLTMGENIADLGGLLLALDAYHAALNGKEAPVLDGLTGDQRVFLGWSQVWRMKTRDEAAINWIKTDPHALPHFRVNGPVRNIPDWYEAFKITPDDPMYLAPEKRVRIW
jgi:putative endopeptidase